MLSTGDPPQNRGHIQTESEGLERYSMQIETKRKQDLNYRRKTIKNSNIWRLNNTLLNNQQITEEIKKKSKYS